MPEFLMGSRATLRLTAAGEATILAGVHIPQHPYEEVV